MRTLVCGVGLSCFTGAPIDAPPPAAATTQRATAHAMRYHLALPAGWTSERTWAVVVVIPDAAREFEANLQAFVAARGARPFILVAPEVLSCGGASSRTAAFLRPERWRAVAPVSTNYQRRDLDPATFSSAPERATLPLQVFRCGAPTGAAVAGLRFFDRQTAQALADARAHGFAPLPVHVVPGADHGPLPGPVLAWFETLLRR